MSTSTRETLIALGGVIDVGNDDAEAARITIEDAIIACAEQHGWSVGGRLTRRGETS